MIAKVSESLVEILDGKGDYSANDFVTECKAGDVLTGMCTD
ncbi:hypothetical protein ACFYXF_35060 [Streptomyces sp. NPDC002680]